MDWVERIVLAVPSTMIASIVAWIAYQQYEINRQKLKLDLYDRRFKIYSGAIDLVRVACRTTPENHKEITEQIDNEFRYHLSSAYFLLNREAFKILDSIAQESRDLASTMQLRLSVLEELKCLKESNTKERSEINDKRKSLDVTIESFRKSLSQTSRINFAFEKYLDFRSLYGN